MPGYYMAFIDCVIVMASLGITALALNKLRLPRKSTVRVAAIGMSGVVIGLGNLLLDAHWVIPQVKTITAVLTIIYLAGASKGILLGLLSSLILFRQLRPPQQQTTLSEPT